MVVLVKNRAIIHLNTQPVVQQGDELGHPPSEAQQEPSDRDAGRGLAEQGIPKSHGMKIHDLVKDIDIEDHSFRAVHLHKKHKIWTGDNVLVKGPAAKNYDIFVTTAERKQKRHKK